MVMKIYVDTSVFGGCFDAEFEGVVEQAGGRGCLCGFKVAVISDLTLRELEDAPLKVRNLVGKYQKNTKNMLF